jgi:hypothetical protein
VAWSLACSKNFLEFCGCKIGLLLTYLNEGEDQAIAFGFDQMAPDFHLPVSASVMALASPKRNR